MPVRDISVMLTRKTRPNQKLSREVTAPIPGAFTAAIDGRLRAERPSPWFSCNDPALPDPPIEDTLAANSSDGDEAFCEKEA